MKKYLIAIIILIGMVFCESTNTFETGNTNLIASKRGLQVEYIIKGDDVAIKSFEFRRGTKFEVEIITNTWGKAKKVLKKTKRLNKIVTKGEEKYKRCRMLVGGIVRLSLRIVSLVRDIKK
jgi:hypothetical protein